MKIAVIGGGTGAPEILRGFEHYLTNQDTLSAIANMVDDGGHTGDMVDRFGVLPPGDLLRCGLALSRHENGWTRELLLYRFDYGRPHTHSLGNEILAALEKIGKSLPEGIKYFKELLAIPENRDLFPITLDKTQVCGTTKTGQELNGQTQLSYPADPNAVIQNVELRPQAELYKEAKTALLDSDLIVVAPGDLYGSIIPNFLVNGMRRALSETDAKFMYVCNIVTKEGSKNFRVSNFVREIERYSARKLDRILVNSSMPSDDTTSRYHEQGQDVVKNDMEGVERVVSGDYLVEYRNVPGLKGLLRHDPIKVVRDILKD